MKESLLIALCLPVGLIGGVVGAKLMGGSDGVNGAPLRAESPADGATSVGEHGAELARLSVRVDDLVARVDALVDQRRTALAAGNAATPLAESSDAGVTVGGEPASEQPLDLARDSDWLVFTDPNASLEARQAAWASLRERGLLDEALALAEARAEASPDDPDAQFDLGVGYIEKIQEVGGGIEAGKWATKADDAFDRSLTLDEEHLEARLYKAMSLSFWPPIFGKRAEAIAQFETLIEKQASHPAQDHFANSYTLLGNLHMESGNAAKALEVWKAGAAAFPEDADLAAKIAAAGGS